LIALMADTPSSDPAGTSAAATSADDAAGSTEQTKREGDLAGLVEEAAAGMRQLMTAAMPGSGTGGVLAQDARQAMARLVEGVMATNKGFADELLSRVAPGPTGELQRRFVHEYFDALGQGGTLLLHAAGQAAEQHSEKRMREHDGQEGVAARTAGGQEVGVPPTSGNDCQQARHRSQNAGGAEKKPPTTPRSSKRGGPRHGASSGRRGKGK
jgi:hypothetical protein